MKQGPAAVRRSGWRDEERGCGSLEEDVQASAAFGADDRVTGVGEQSAAREIVNVPAIGVRRAEAVSAAATVAVPEVRLALTLVALTTLLVRRIPQPRLAAVRYQRRVRSRRLGRH